MKRNTNFLSESMAQIEYYANKAANDLTNGEITMIEEEEVLERFALTMDI